MPRFVLKMYIKRYQTLAGDLGAHCDRGICPLLLGSVGVKGRQELWEDTTILHGVLIITLREHDEKIESRRRTWEQNSPYSVHSGKFAE